MSSKKKQKNMSKDGFEKTQAPKTDLSRLRHCYLPEKDGPKGVFREANTFKRQVRTEEQEADEEEAIEQLQRWAEDKKQQAERKNAFREG